MKFFIIASFLVACVVAHDDGQWKGEGLLESQDWGQYNGHGVYAAGWAPSAWNHGAAWGVPAALAVRSAWAPSVWAHGGAPIGHDGRVVDTPEVAHAKAAHFAAKAAATHGAVGAWAPATYAAAWAPAVWGHGAPLGPDGRVVDTPEVAHAKAAHFAAKAAATHGAVGAWAPATYAAGWAPAVWSHGGAPIGIDGRVVDTPEVAHAKAAHFAAKAAATHGAHWW